MASSSVRGRMHRSSGRLAPIVLALGLLAAACASVEALPVERVQVANVSVLPGADGFLNPLTGVVSYVPQDWQERPALAIKVGNSGNERPQAGLDDADLVFEELTEAGVTRFVAVFLTESPDRVGPVRSVRTVDPDLLAPLNALFGYSGGVPEIVAKVRESGSVVDVSANRVPSAYARDSARRAPYNYYTSTRALWEAQGGDPPEPQFEFLTSADDIGAGSDSEATEVYFTFGGGGSRITYDYDTQTGRYRRSQGTTEHMVEGPDEGIQLSFTNVIVQMVDVSPGSTIDQAGNRTTDIEVVGSGGVMLARGGRAFGGTWQRPALDARTTYTSDDGGPLQLAPGPTIVELLPTGQEVFVS